MSISVKITLQKLVLDRMSPHCSPLSNEEIEQWIKSLPEINEEIIEMTRQTVFGSLPDKLMIRHLNQFRKECTLMLDALHGYPACTGEMEKLYHMVVSALVAIFEFQRKNYGKYLDANVTMPAILYHEAAQKIEVGTILMVTAMTRYHAHKTLQAVVVGKMSCLLKNGTGSWHQVSYLEKLQRCIMELCAGCPLNITEALRDLLLRANFNTYGFIAYCKSRIQEEMAENYEVHDQYDCLFRYQLEFSTLFYQHEFEQFEPKQTKVKTVLLQYVNSELSIMDRKYQSRAEHKAVESSGLGSRLSVSISVDALAYFFRLLLMAGVTAGSKNELFLFISKNFSTPGAAEAGLSIKSIENKFRQVVKNTAITVKSILLKMLKQLDEEFT